MGKWVIQGDSSSLHHYWGFTVLALFHFSCRLGTENGESLLGDELSLGYNLPTFHRPELSHMALPNCKEGWECNMPVQKMVSQPVSFWRKLHIISPYSFTTNSRFMLHFCDFQCQWLFFYNHDAGWSHPVRISLTGNKKDYSSTSTIQLPIQQNYQEEH